MIIGKGKICFAEELLGTPFTILAADRNSLINPREPVGDKVMAGVIDEQKALSAAGVTVGFSRSIRLSRK